MVELKPQTTGSIMLSHPAASKQGEGQVLVTLAFDVEDVEAFWAAARAKGLASGTAHKSEG
jgi:hypothetical protein